jgi:cyclopropane-fatty-acyl-phospholipid synthase
VGFRNHKKYMEVVIRCLKEGGLFLLHTIGNHQSEYAGDPWIDKYIFTNSLIPSMKQITTAAEDLFVLEDVQNLGFHYDATLMAWYNNFNRSWNEIRDKYGDTFYRMWKYYLLSSAGSFRAHQLQVWQIVFSQAGSPGMHSVIR